jgi:hypothetical protein
MNLMQQDSKKAKEKFEGDKDVDLFMREFGGVMSAHFNGLGNSNPNPNTNSTSNSTSNPSSSSSSDKNEIKGSLISELNYKKMKDTNSNPNPNPNSNPNPNPNGHGVLQAEAIERERIR